MEKAVMVMMMSVDYDTLNALVYHYWTGLAALFLMFVSEKV